MAKAMRYTGDNAQAVAKWATGSAMKQVVKNGDVVGYELAAPARSGGVYLSLGDFFVREDDGGFVRLSPDQMAEEHPLLLAALDAAQK